MANYRAIDIPSFVSRHVYEFYINCDYDGPTWTSNLSLDLRIIAAMPVLYPEQTKAADRKEGGQISAAVRNPRLQKSLLDKVSAPEWVNAGAA